MKYTARLSEKEIIEAIKLFLRERGDVPSSVTGVIRFRFGLIGEPTILLTGDATELPNAGDVYFDWTFEPTPNVAVLPKKKRFT